MTNIKVVSDVPEDAASIVSEEALAFLAELQTRFGTRRDELLVRRQQRRAEAARTGRLDFLPETADVRAGDWKVAGQPPDLRDRRVEMTGPTDRKMSINALNSGAQVWLADMEDASTPHWSNVLESQVSLYDGIRRRLAYTSPEGKEYTLDEKRLATIVMRPRGWHFDEANIVLDGTPIVGALVDFGLYFFHNAAELIERGSGPYFYLPKMESYLEARLWNDVFTFAEDYCSIPYGTIRATVLIETFPAAFEMDEILYELRDHASGLNAGRWDYLFSIIKTFRERPEFVLPDRNVVGMASPFMRAYAELLVKTCHRRGAMAIGGMSAFIPSRRDEEVNKVAFAKVREDKDREAGQGFDGSWVAHPDLVPLCREVFDGVLGERPNQVDRQRDDVTPDAGSLLDVTTTPGEVTLTGIHNNVQVSLLYLASWLGGGGAVAINNLMEDAATAEIARSQIWQWVRHQTKLDDGTTVTKELVESVVDEEYAKIREAVDDEAFESGHYALARRIFTEIALADEYADFLTLPAYRAVIDHEG